MEYPNVHASPNFEPGAEYTKRTGHARRPTMAVLHITEGTYPGDLNYLADPAPGGDPGKAVSCHLYIKRDGTPIQMVEFDDIAWTQGLSDESLRTNRPDLWNLHGWGGVNAYCLSIEFEAKYGEQITTAQQTSGAKALAKWCKKYPGILPDRLHIVGHYEINNQKTDPTQPFDWEGLMVKVHFELSPPLPPTPLQPQYFPQTGFTIQGGFQEFFNAFGGVHMFGYPLTGEVQEDGLAAVQYFENCRFEYRPDAPPGERVRLGRVGRMYLHLRGLVP